MFLKSFFSHTVLSNTNDFQTDLFDLQIKPKQILHFRIREDPRVKAMKEYTLHIFKIGDLPSVAV